ncbi:MAG: glycosyltransferase family 4 protein [Chloroflexales bacterium]|nr:glycosyltransferase family 4 protein [Chloroflexales bacterium]
MRILYIASGIPVPGTLGGSTHAFEVARGLTQRGHAVHLVAASKEGWSGLAPFTRPVSSRLAGFHLHHQDIPKSIALLGVQPILRLVCVLRPDVIIERYYNFAGAGIWAARRLGIPSLLEVNALIIDPPAVFKRRLDDALGGPMRRWAITQCHWASRIVTPLHTTVPAEIPRRKIVELSWGADVERFAIERQNNAPNSNCQASTAIFLGSFRAWHGVIDFVRAAILLLKQGCDYRFVLVGDGPERALAEQLAAAWPGRFHFTGALAYEMAPDALRSAGVGVAPFNTAPHPALRTAGFFWSPLKIYEYMAAGLPVVTTDLAPLNQVIREGVEGTLFREGDITGLAAAMDRVLRDPAAAQAMGARARERVVARYSWQRHCAELERVLEEMRHSG